MGLPVPPFTAHAISVSLPTWRDNVDYEEGNKRVVDAQVSGYPRFFIHLSIQKVRRHTMLSFLWDVSCIIQVHEAWELGRMDRMT